MRFGKRAVTVAAAAALAATAVAAWPAHAATSTLSGPRFGVVDFGDGVDYAVTGADCAAHTVLVRASLAGGRVLDGAASQPGTGAVPGSCVGIARVPTFEDVAASGWRQGDEIAFDLVDGDQRVPLRYQRIEVDRAGGADGLAHPAVVDPDTGPSDPVVTMSTGDAVDLGRVNLDHIDSVALRVCITNAGDPTNLRPATGTPIGSPLDYTDVPVRVSVNQQRADGPPLVDDVDISSDPATFGRVERGGFGDPCWRLVSLVVTGRPVEQAPHVFLTVDAAAPGTLTVNSIDFNGAGARSSLAPNWSRPDPAGMQTIFDGTSFDGWTQTGCALMDGAATNAPRNSTTDRASVTGCNMTFDSATTNQVIRLEVRRENFLDNGGIYIPHEIQLRSQGEYLPGGYSVETAARWQKLNSWPLWNQVEIVQLGARHVVRINGRTVMDHLASAGSSAPYHINLVTEPSDSPRWGANFDPMSPVDVPNVLTPADWGNFWYRAVRTYQCTSLGDPVCTSLAGADAGQVRPA